MYSTVQLIHAVPQRHVSLFSYVSRADAETE